MALLVLNGGSSSLKFSVFERRTVPELVFEGEVEDVGGDAQLALNPVASGAAPSRRPVAAKTVPEALAAALDALGEEQTQGIEAVGYRVVHPGPHLEGHQRITPEVLRALEAAAAFAPLHDPPARELIQLGIQRFPSIPHFACFDTVFHRTMPPEATTYALPQEIRERGVRRYGFHGLSCESIVYQLAAAGGVPGRMAISHLGSGCSVTTCLDGRSVDNTMGLTPTGGLVMGTRPGDLDPGLMVYLFRQAAKDGADAAAAIEAMVNHKAGMVALSELENDMRVVREAAANGNADAKLALAVFVRSVTKALGAACFLLGGLDAIVFTGGIGQHDAATRAEALAGLTPLEIGIDPERNAAAGGKAVSDITASNSQSRTTDSSNIGSKTRILVLTAQEDLMIARHVDGMLTAAGQGPRQA